MKLPTAADLDLPEERVQTAVLVAELLLGLAIRPRQVTQEVYLGGTSQRVLLDHYPLREIRFEGAPGGRQFWTEPEIGLVGAGDGVTPASYRVDATVGYEPDDLPALICVLVEKVARWEPGDAEAAQEALQIAEAGRLALVQPAVTARETYKE